MEKGRSAPGWLLLIAVLTLSPVVSAQDSQSPSEDTSLIEQTEKLLVRIQRNRVEIDALRSEQGESQGEDVILLERRLRRIGLETLADVDTFVENTVTLEQEGQEVTELQAAAVDLVTGLAPLARRRIGALLEEISELAGRREAATGEELITTERDLATANEALSIVLRAGLDNATHMQELGVDPAAAGAEKTNLSEILVERAKLTAERIDLTMDQISATQDRLKDKPDDADLSTLLAADEAKLASNHTDLVATIEMLNELEIDTTEYQQLLIEATGQITTDILDSGVAVGLLQQWLTGLKDWIVENGPPLVFRAILFLLILFLFRVLARLTRKVVQRTVSASKLNFSAPASSARSTR